jgi:hypothetical protein
LAFAALCLDNFAVIHERDETQSRRKKMEPLNFRRLRGSVKVLSAVLGAGTVVTAGALTVAYQGNEVGTSNASTSGWEEATVTRSASPPVPETPFATPPHTATPCAKRAVYPC